MTENHSDITLAEQYAAALEWWRDAGVDCDFSDEAQSWLEEPEENRPAPAPAALTAEPEEEAPKPPSISVEDLPADLAAFRTWWCDAESPLPAGPAPRIAPRGEIGASLMVLAPMPEASDNETLLQGIQGRLLANVARAVGIDPEAIYFASALPSHMPLPDWTDLHREGLGAAVKHHVTLAKPDRVILFGSKLPALFGHDPGAPPESFSEIAGIPTLTTFAPERLLDHPRQRARLWHRLLKWTPPI